MSQPAPTRAQKARSLTQQQTDFTSEGSPPPGKVATSAPVTGHNTTKATSPAPAAVRRAPKRPPSGRGR